MADSTGARKELAELAKKIQVDINEFTKKHHLSFINEKIFPDEDITLIMAVITALRDLQWEMLNAKGE